MENTFQQVCLHYKVYNICDVGNCLRTPKLTNSAQLKSTFQSGKTLSLEWRRTQLKALHTGIKELCDDFVKALQQDLGRPQLEALQELLSITSELAETISKLPGWMQPQQVEAPATMPNTRPFIHYRPKGLVLIISPFNFPINLALSPLLGAIAAGNCCVLKPSELTPNCARMLQTICEKYLDQTAIRCIQGGVDETTELLKLPFDHFFYTGNGRVGRIVMKAAAEHLAGVTLELGGKSPVYVHEDANLDIAARRILAGKYLNDGQVCLAPDYILMNEKIRDQLIAKMCELLPTMYGEKKDGMARLVNEHHFDRVRKMLEENHGGKVLEGGLDKSNRKDKYIPPTFVLDPSPKSSVLNEEIFGPVLPIVTVQSLDQAVKVIRAKENPLGAYVFTRDSKTSERFFQQVPSGGGCVNDVVYHIRNKNLPFGGSGKSGIGYYGGKFSFDELSYKQSVLECSADNDTGRMYPPLSPKLFKLLKAAL